MNAHDTFAVDTARAAIKAALAGLDTAYKACTDSQIEDQIVAAIDELNERLGHLEVITDAIEANRAPWFRSYAAVFKIMAQHIVAYEDTTGYAPADCRWCAYDDSTYDGPGCPLGKGATEAEAIADLEQLLDDADEAAALAADALCDYCNGAGMVTVRTTFPCSYVCAGEPPEDARGMTGAPCGECHSFYRRERAA